MIIDWSGTRDGVRCFKVMEGDNVLYQGFEVRLVNVSGACAGFEGGGVLSLEGARLRLDGDIAIIEGAIDAEDLEGLEHPSDLARQAHRVAKGSRPFRR